MSTSSEGPATPSGCEREQGSGYGPSSSTKNCIWRRRRWNRYLMESILAGLQPVTPAVDLELDLLVTGRPDAKPRAAVSKDRGAELGLITVNWQSNTMGLRRGRPPGSVARSHRVRFFLSSHRGDSSRSRPMPANGTGIQSGRCCSSYSSS